VKDDVKDVFFDLDHTLWDFERNSALAFAKLLTQYEVPVSLADFLAVYSPINISYWERFRKDQVTKINLRRGRLMDSFAIFSLRYDVDILDQMAETYIQELPKNNHLFPGVMPTLEYLKAQYRLHIITNGFHQVQHTKLINSGLDHYFDSVTTSEEVGVKKPNPVIFRFALEKVKAKPSASIMIGDNFEADIVGAESVGMKTLFFNYWQEERSSNYLKISEIPQIKLHL
jgi:putative hydrolase of the HAD superfamily